eukprot:scaffold45833_cov37-Phaeocystis_antarctica.AAC.4
MAASVHGACGAGGRAPPAPEGLGGRAHPRPAAAVFAPPQASCWCLGRVRPQTQDDLWAAECRFKPGATCGLWLACAEPTVRAGADCVKPRAGRSLGRAQRWWGRWYARAAG